MRRPKRAGIPIDAKRLSGWRQRFPGYRREVTRRRTLAWINQFDADDHDLAARLLDCIAYVTHEAMDDAFRTIIARLPGWNLVKSKRRGKWRFVAFSIAAGESGDMMLHKWRSATGLSAGNHDELFIHKSELLNEQLGGGDTVVFVDDFAGTGDQVCEGWHEVMAELLPGSPSTYLVLVAASRIARRRIRSETPLRVESRFLLEEDDNIFSPDCVHFAGDEKGRLLDYSARADAGHPRGFGDCGFVIVFAHRTPDNSIPVLHANHQGWVGLFPRD